MIEISKNLQRYIEKDQGAEPKVKITSGSSQIFKNHYEDWIRGSLTNVEIVENNIQSSNDYDTINPDLSTAPDDNWIEIIEDAGYINFDTAQSSIFMSVVSPPAPVIHNGVAAITRDIGCTIFKNKPITMGLSGVTFDNIGFGSKLEYGFKLNDTGYIFVSLDKTGHPIKLSVKIKETETSDIKEYIIVEDGGTSDDWSNYEWNKFEISLVNNKVYITFDSDYEDYINFKFKKHNAVIHLDDYDLELSGIVYPMVRLSGSGGWFDEYKLDLRINDIWFNQDRIENGEYISEVIEVPAFVEKYGLITWKDDVPEGTELKVFFRNSEDGTAFSDWQLCVKDQELLVENVYSFVQFKAEFIRNDQTIITLKELSLRYSLKTSLQTDLIQVHQIQQKLEQNINEFRAGNCNIEYTNLKQEFDSEEFRQSIEAHEDKESIYNIQTGFADEFIDYFAGKIENYKTDSESGICNITLLDLVRHFSQIPADKLEIHDKQSVPVLKVIRDVLLDQGMTDFSKLSYDVIERDMLLNIMLDLDIDLISPVFPFTPGAVYSVLKKVGNALYIRQRFFRHEKFLKWEIGRYSFETGQPILETVFEIDENFKKIEEINNIFYCITSDAGDKSELYVFDFGANFQFLFEYVNLRFVRTGFYDVELDRQMGEITTGEVGVSKKYCYHPSVFRIKIGSGWSAYFKVYLNLLRIEVETGKTEYLLDNESYPFVPENSYFIGDYFDINEGRDFQQAISLTANNDYCFFVFRILRNLGSGQPQNRIIEHVIFEKDNFSNISGLIRNIPGTSLSSLEYKNICKIFDNNLLITTLDRRRKSQYLDSPDYSVMVYGGATTVVNLETNSLENITETFLRATSVKDNRVFFVNEMTGDPDGGIINSGSIGYIDLFFPGHNYVKYQNVSRFQNEGINSIAGEDRNLFILDNTGLMYNLGREVFALLQNTNFTDMTLWDVITEIAKMNNQKVFFHGTALVMKSDHDNIPFDLSDFLIDVNSITVNKTEIRNQITVFYDERRHSVTALDVESINEYYIQEYETEAPFVITQRVAEDIANSILELYKSPYLQVSAICKYIPHLQLLDCVYIENPKFNLHGYFKIKQVVQNTIDFRTQFALQKIEIDTYAVKFSEVNNIDGISIQIIAKNLNWKQVDIGQTVDGVLEVMLPIGLYKWIAKKSGYTFLSGDFIVDRDDVFIEFELTESEEYNITFSEANETPGVEIKIYRDAGRVNLFDTITTGATGEVSILLSNNTYYFTAEKSGYVFYEGSFTVTGADDTVNFELIPVYQVTFSEDNSLSGVKINIQGYPEVETVDGQAVLHLPSGNYEGIGNKAGYNEYQFSFEVDGAGKTINFEMVVSAKITFQEDNSLEGVRITIFQGDFSVIIETDSTGEAEIVLLAGVYNYLITFEGYVSQEGVFTVTNDDDDFNFEMIPGFNVNFNILSNSLIENAQVHVYSDSGKTNLVTILNFQDIPPAGLTVSRLLAAGEYYLTGQVITPASKFQILDDTFEVIDEGIEHDLLFQGVEVSVTFRETLGLSGVLVRVFSNSARTILIDSKLTGSAGIAVFQLSKNQYWYTATRDGYYQNASSFFVEFTAKEIPFTMVGVGQILFQELNDLDNVKITIAGVGIVYTVNGVIQVTVPDGTYNWTAEKEGFWETGGQVTKTGDEVVIVEFEMQPAYFLTFTEKKDRTGVEISVYYDEGLTQPAGQRVTVDGHAQLRLLAGQYYFVLSKDEYYNIVDSILIDDDKEYEFTMLGLNEGWGGSSWGFGMWGD